MTEVIVEQPLASPGSANYGNVKLGLGNRFILQVGGVISGATLSISHIKSLLSYSLEVLKMLKEESFM